MLIINQTERANNSNVRIVIFAGMIKTKTTLQGKKIRKRRHQAIYTYVEQQHDRQTEMEKSDKVQEIQKLIDDMEIMKAQINSLNRKYLFLFCDSFDKGAFKSTFAQICRFLTQLNEF